MRGLLLFFVFLLLGTTIFHSTGELLCKAENPPKSITILRLGGKDYEQQIKPGETLNVPVIAPGQVLEIGLNPRVFDGGRYGEGGNFDSIVAENLPEGWSADKSRGYLPMYIKIYVSQFSKDGDYIFDLKLVDEHGLDCLGDFIIPVKVTVNKDIVEIKSKPEYVGYADTPIVLDFVIKNNGNYPDVFTLHITGEKLPKITFKDILLQPGQEKIIEVTEKFGEAVTYSGKVFVYSQSSNLIKKEAAFTIKNKRTLASEFSSIKNGVLVFPANIYYSFTALIAEATELLFNQKQ